MISKTVQDLYDEASNYSCDTVKEFYHIMKNLVEEDGYTITLNNIIILNRVLNLHLKKIIANHGDRSQVIWFIENVNNYALRMLNNIDLNNPMGAIAIEEIRQLIELSIHLIEVENGMFDH